MDKIDLIEKIKETKSTPIAQKIKERTNAFDNLNQQSNDKWFSELCFCILTANFNAKGAIKIQENLFFNFAVLPQNELEKQLRQFGHRFPNKRAEFIFEAQRYSNNIKTIITSLNEQDARAWLVKNIKGIGMKEASHFLRYVG